MTCGACCSAIRERYEAAHCRFHEDKAALHEGVLRECKAGRKRSKRGGVKQRMKEEQKRNKRIKTKQKNICCDGSLIAQRIIIITIIIIIIIIIIIAVRSYFGSRPRGHSCAPLPLK